MHKNEPMELVFFNILGCNMEKSPLELMTESYNE